MISFEKEYSLFYIQPPPPQTKKDIQSKDYILQLSPWSGLNKSFLFLSFFFPFLQIMK